MSSDPNRKTTKTQLPWRRDDALSDARVRLAREVAEAADWLGEAPGRIAVVVAGVGIGKTTAAMDAIAKHDGLFVASSHQLADEHFATFSHRHPALPAMRLAGPSARIGAELEELLQAWSRRGHYRWDLIEPDDDKDDDEDVDEDEGGASILFGVRPHLAMEASHRLVVWDEAPELCSRYPLSRETIERLAAPAPSDALANHARPRQRWARIVLAAARKVAEKEADAARARLGPYDADASPYLRRVMRLPLGAISSGSPAFFARALDSYREYADAVARDGGLLVPPPEPRDRPPARQMRPSEWPEAFTDMVMLAAGLLLLGDAAMEVLDADLREALGRVHVELALGPRLGDNPQVVLEAFVPVGHPVLPWHKPFPSESSVMILDGTAALLHSAYIAAFPGRNVRFFGGDATLTELPVVARQAVVASSIFFRSALVHRGMVSARAHYSVARLLSALGSTLGASAGAAALLVLPRQLAELVDEMAGLVFAPVEHRAETQWLSLSARRSSLVEREFVAQLRPRIELLRDLGTLVNLRSIHQHGLRGTNEFEEFDVAVTTSSLRDLSIDQANARCMGLAPETYPHEQAGAEVEQQHGRVRAALSRRGRLLVHGGGDAPSTWAGRPHTRVEVTQGPLAGRGRDVASLLVRELIARGYAVTPTRLSALAADEAAWGRLALPEGLRGALATRGDAALRAAIADAFAQTWPRPLVELVVPTRGKQGTAWSRTRFGLERLEAALVGNVALLESQGETRPLVAVLGRIATGVPVLVTWLDELSTAHARRLVDWLDAPPELPPGTLVIDPYGVVELVDGWRVPRNNGGGVRLVDPAWSLDRLAVKDDVDLGDSPVGYAGLDATDAELARAEAWIGRVAAYLARRTRVAGGADE